MCFSHSKDALSSTWDLVNSCFAYQSSFENAAFLSKKKKDPSLLSFSCTLLLLLVSSIFFPMQGIHLSLSWSPNSILRLLVPICCSYNSYDVINPSHTLCTPFVHSIEWILNFQRLSLNFLKYRIRSDFETYFSLPTSSLSTCESWPADMLFDVWELTGWAWLLLPQCSRYSAVILTRVLI